MDFEELETIDIDINEMLKTALVGALNNLQIAYLSKLNITTTPEVRERIGLISERQVSKLFD